MTSLIVKKPQGNLERYYVRTNGGIVEIAELCKLDVSTIHLQYPYDHSIYCPQIFCNLRV